jgi:hypothetical protein
MPRTGFAASELAFGEPTVSGFRVLRSREHVDGVRHLRESARARHRCCCSAGRPLAAVVRFVSLGA